jgi:ATP-dependent 26S proteasome regulatory subunit
MARKKSTLAKTKTKTKTKKGVLAFMHEPHDLLFQILINPKAPPEHRYTILRDLLHNENPQSPVILQKVLETLSNNSGEARFKEQEQKVNALLQELSEGPLRQGVFIQIIPPNGNGVAHAFILLEDGTPIFSVIPDEELARTIGPGARVMLDGKGRAVLHRAPDTLRVGEVAQLERCIDDQHVELSLHVGAERAVFFAPPQLIAQIRSGEISPGAGLIVNPRQSCVVAAIPPQEGENHYRFVDPSPVPDVIVARDIGAPPRVIAEVDRHLQIELHRPEIHRRYRIRRCFSRLLTGVSGSGKTLAVNAIYRIIYEHISQITGLPVDKLPRRVFRIRQSKMLSQWLGQSEKNWDRALTEVESLADEPYTTPDGREVKLPVLLVLEEVEGLGRTRGDEPIQDRILTEVLQRLDPNRQELSNRLIIVLATTNAPELLDAALLRRLGASIEVFGRLKRAAFRAVLEKHVRDLPRTAALLAWWSWFTPAAQRPSSNTDATSCPAG